MAEEKKRIVSIDALRGLDMVLLSGGAAVLWQLCRLGWGNEVPGWLATQFRHAENNVILEESSLHGAVLEQSFPINVGQHRTRQAWG